MFIVVRITTVVFDKTGTLTTGRPVVTDKLVLRDSELTAKGMHSYYMVYLVLMVCHCLSFSIASPWFDEQSRR